MIPNKTKLNDLLRVPVSNSENPLCDYVLNCRGDIIASQQRDVIVDTGKMVNNDLRYIRVKDINSRLMIVLIASKENRTLKILANGTKALYNNLFEMSIAELLQNHGIGFYPIPGHKIEHILEMTQEDSFFDCIRSATIGSYEYVVEEDLIYVIGPDEEYLRDIEEIVKTIFYEEE